MKVHSLINGLLLICILFAIIQSADAVQTTVQVTLYMHEGSPSGSVLSGMQISGQDGAGVSFSRTTDSSGAITISGAPGTWQFSAAKDGYDSASWSNYITISKRLDGYLKKTPVAAAPVQTTVQVTLYMHEGSSSGLIVPGMQISGQDGSGVSFIRVTDSSGAITISGAPGTWQFSAAKDGYDSASWSNYITVSKRLDGYLKKTPVAAAPVQTTVQVTLYMHEGSSSGLIVPGMQITGQDGSGVSFIRVTDSSGAITISGAPGTWQFSAAKDGYDSASWSNYITVSKRLDGYLKKTPVAAAPVQTTVQVTLYMHEGSSSGLIVPGMQISGQDGAGVSFSRTTDSSGAITISGAPGTWQFSAAKDGYDSASWSNYITVSKRLDGYLKKTPVAAAPVQTTVQVTLYMHEGSTTGDDLSGVTVTGHDGSGKTFNQVTDAGGKVILTGSSGSWHFEITKTEYTQDPWDETINSNVIRQGYMNPVNPPKSGPNLEVPYFAQNGQSWSSTKLGFGSGSIGDFGCTLSSTAMVLKYYGVNTDPGLLNDWLKNHDGFDTDLIKWLAVPGIDSSITLNPQDIIDFSSSAADLDKINTYLDQGYPVITKVYYTNLASHHWVVIIGHQTNQGVTTYTINDPYYNSNLGGPATQIPDSRFKVFSPSVGAAGTIEKIIVYKGSRNSIELQPKLVTDKATDVTGISATLHGQIENAKAGETYQVCFRYDKDGLKPTTPKIEVTQNNPSFSYTLTGLTPGAAYSFRAVSINSPDPIDAVNVESFNTISPSDTTSCSINSQRPTINWPDNGWFYPLLSPEGNELSKKETIANAEFDSPNPTASNKRHLGYDLMCDGRTINCPELKYSVHAIGDGTVVDVSHHTGWGGDDSAKPNLIVIKHKAADGTIFYALYGHLQNIPTNLKTVSKGQFIGNTLKVNEEHLHFTLDDGSTSAATQRYAGYTASIDKHAGDYGFHDPVVFLKDHKPESALQPPISNDAKEKQQKILDMVNKYRGEIPPELVLAIIAQESGDTTFINPNWIQPSKKGGIMQVINDDYAHFNKYTENEQGYQNAIKDGCDYLNWLYKEHSNDETLIGTFVETTIHYNTGPGSLLTYLGHHEGDPSYLEHISNKLDTIVPKIYSIKNPELVTGLKQGQDILDEFLQNKELKNDQDLGYYSASQRDLDKKLRAIGITQLASTTTNNKNIGEQVNPLVYNEQEKTPATDIQKANFLSTPINVPDTVDQQTLMKNLPSLFTNNNPLFTSNFLTVNPPATLVNKQLTTKIDTTAEEPAQNIQKSQSIENTIPSQVLSPVVGSIGFTTCCEESCKNRVVDKWEFCQHKSPIGFVKSDTGEWIPIGHTTNGGIGRADDTYAWDINLNLPNKKDEDKGKPVYAVASGKIAKTYGDRLNIGGTLGQVLLEHPGGWWSGYLHMKNVRVVEGQDVNENTILGYISNEGVDDNHLHFVIYKGENKFGGLESFNAEIISRETNPSD